MRCVFCQNLETKVIDKRDIDSETRRRRECLKCTKRFTTSEQIRETPFSIVKKDGRREQFDREKLTRGLLKACEKRPIPIEKIEHAVDKIEGELRKLNLKEIKSIVIGDKVIRELKKLDPVAYVRFASVYKEFKDIEDFKKEIQEIKRK
ncbi:MAG: transcriptional regulator NrdR [bacterium]|nr:transcriptional regulator NrdR [bacterium]